MTKNAELNDFIVAEYKPSWINKTNSPFGILEEGWWQIMRFYMFHCPVEKVSARGKGLRFYKWGEKSNSADFKLLKRRLILFSDMEENRFLHDQNWDNLKDLYIANDLAEFPEMTNTERLAFLVDKGGINESLFNHIRNSIAHGRVAVYNHDGQIYSALEDIRPDRRVSARMILKMKTLLSWIKIIKAGPFVLEDDLKNMLLD